MFHNLWQIDLTKKLHNFFFDTGTLHWSKIMVSRKDLRVERDCDKYNFFLQIMLGICDDWKITKSQYWLYCTLRSWLHKISTWIGILSPGLENNHTWKCCSDNFPTWSHLPGLLEKSRTNISIYGCSPVQGTRSWSL